MKKDINDDMADAAEAGKTPDEVRDAGRQRTANRKPVPIVEDDAAWPEPRLFNNAELPPVPALTQDMLPGAFKTWLQDIMERMQVPLEYLAIPVLVACASLIGRKVCIRPKQYDDWTEAANLWGLIIGPPGVLKTPALNEALRPLKQLEAKAQEQYRAAVEKYSQEMKIFEAKDKAYRKALESAANEGKVSKIEPPLEPKKLPSPRFMVSDATIEKLGEILCDNPNGVLSYRDEMKGFLNSLQKKGHESDRQFYLEAWNGMGSFIFDRISRGTVHIPQFVLSLLGGIQPGPMSEHLAGVSSGGADDDGFVQRFQLTVFPEPPPTWTNVDRNPDKKSMEDAYAVFKRLAELEPGQVPSAEFTHNGQGYIRFRPDAQKRFINWREVHENRVRNPGHEIPAIIAVLAKYRGLVPRLALLFQMIDRPGIVELDALELAIRWAEFLEAHARKIYSSQSTPYWEAKVQRWLVHDASHQFSERDLYQKFRELSNTQLRNEILAHLAERDLIRPAPVKERTGKGRNGSPVWIVNPKLKVNSE